MCNNLPIHNHNNQYLAERIHPSYRLQNTFWKKVVTGIKELLKSLFQLPATWVHDAHLSQDTLIMIQSSLLGAACAFTYADFFKVTHKFDTPKQTQENNILKQLTYKKCLSANNYDLLYFLINMFYKHRQ